MAGQMGDWLPSTVWTAIAQARSGGRPALDALLRKYYPPVLSMVKGAGFREQDAEDVTQEVFLRLVSDDIVGKADPSRGRFRGLVLTVAKQVIVDRRRFDGREKRGGGTRPVAMTGDVAQAADRDAAFDHLWIENLVRVGMNELRRECEREKTEYFRALMMTTDEGLGYAEVATQLGVPLAQVKNFVHQARLRLKRYVLFEIEQYSASREEYDSEVAYLMKFLA
jgi:RNA polymerase sigma-70 factor (ECF subfamily)